MNSEAEIQLAYQDYRQTEFGGWPWDRKDPVHGKAKSVLQSTLMVKKK